MESPTISTLTFILFLALSCSWAAYADENQHFLQCIRVQDEFKNYSISDVVYTRSNSSYDSILKFAIRNLRFASQSTPKPVVIVTPERESQIPPIIYCAKKSKLQIRTRSGGHDLEGLSYVSQVPFLVLDMFNFGEVTVNVQKKTAWLGSGANLGKLYYRIAEKSSTLGFPAGLCPSVGAGGHISGGGYGFMLRKYGLAADNVIDARIVDVNGRILDRRAMGEDLFWAIRGGTGSSYGVILAWKVQLVDVPAKVTAFIIQRTSEQNCTKLIQKWQYVAPRIDRNLFLSVGIRRGNSSQDGKNMTITASFFSFYLGGVDQLLALMQEKFPELGLTREDCTEGSWIQTAVFAGRLSGYSTTNSIEDLLSRTQPNLTYFKVKLDYVQNPIPSNGLESMWRSLYEPGGERAEIDFAPYGGRMDDIPASSIPFPHRAGNLFSFTSTLRWTENDVNDSDKYIRWSRNFHRSITPYVSKSPRATYINYRDLDIGVNNARGEISYATASVWGLKYFKNNFNRLVRVKTAVDPTNFFRDEQSIPPLRSR